MTCQYTDIYPLINIHIYTYLYLCSRPKPPVLSSALTTELLLSITMPPSAQDVRLVEGQYRPVGGEFWIDAFPIDISEYLKDGYKLGKSIILRVPSLQPQKKYEARVRFQNFIGYSTYSTRSQPLETLPDSELASTPLKPVVEEWKADAVSSDYIQVKVLSNPTLLAPTKPVVYRLQYRSELEQKWHNYPDMITFSTRREGVEIQKIVTRRNGDINSFNSSTGALLDTTVTQCSGYFWLRLGATASDEVSNSVSPPLPFDASIDQFISALGQIGQIKAANPRITAHRYANEYKGFTWTVEIQGMGDVPRLQLHKHTLMAEDVNTGLVVDECFGASSAKADPLVSATLQNGEDVFTDAQKVIKVGGLKQQLGYVNMGWGLCCMFRAISIPLLCYCHIPHRVVH